MNIKKDKIFLFVSVLVFGVITYNALYMILANMDKVSGVLWFNFSARIIADILALVGILWLIRSYKRIIKIQKEKDNDNIN